MKKLLAMAVVAAVISCKQETKETTAQVDTIFNDVIDK